MGFVGRQINTCPPLEIWATRMTAIVGGDDDHEAENDEDEEEGKTERDDEAHVEKEKDVPEKTTADEVHVL